MEMQISLVFVQSTSLLKQTEAYTEVFSTLQCKWWKHYAQINNIYLISQNFAIGIKS